MTVLTFPTSPIIGQRYNAPNEIQYVFDGVKWTVETVASTSAAVTNSVQDRVAPMFVNGPNTGINFTYNAGTNVMSAAVTAVNGDTLINGVHEFTLESNGALTLPTLTVPLEDNANPIGTGQVLKFSDSTQQAIIFGPVSTSTSSNAERVIIQGAPGYTGTAGEGGDVYVWAGPGGDADGNGGDIKVRAGRGDGTGTGGYLNFQAGDSSTGTGGYINIESGESNTYGSGGDITMQARSGGEITLRTYGPGSKDWLFGADGDLTLPEGGDINIPDGRANVTGTATTVGGGATVGVRSILAIDSAFGSNDANAPASAQAIRGRVTGSNLTKTRNYVAGVTGQYLVTGTNASDFINTGLLGVVGDQTTTANAAVVAYLDGDGGLTTAGSAYGVSMKNSTPGSGFDYGLDLQFIDLNIAGTTAPFKQADIRFNNGVELVANVSNTISIDANLTVTGTTSTSVLSLNSSENLASGAAANLSVTASYFTTSTASTATLAAGTAGLIKTFMMVADGGDMVITVSNAGWKSSGTGTITFNDIGDGCTLQYINSKWFCIGQNGIAFA